jgi:hypothetical protein
MAIKVDESLEDLYELVLKYCNLDPVKELLRRYKRDEDLTGDKRDEIRISGENARKIVTGNLKTAVSRKAIPLDEVFNLLREAEENGRQHIFFFRPRSKEARAKLTDGTKIANTLLGEGWGGDGKFPRLRLQPKGFCWSDFRLAGKNGWMAKLYGHDTVEEQTDEREEGERTRWVKMETRDIRSVCLARWRPREDLLELRVADSQAKMLLGELKQQLVSAIDVDRLCVPWDLSPVRQRLFKEEKNHSEIYECGDWLALDTESYALQGGPHLQDADEKVHAAAATRKLISQVANSDEHDKRKLIVHWKPTESNANKRNLRTIIGTIANTHEMIISAQASSRAIDDVVHRLLTFEI